MSKSESTRVLKMKKARVSDVASLAGVSPSTVTRVLHKNGYVSEANRTKVEKAVSELGYLPNIQARSLRNRRSYAVGLLLSSERANPYYTKVADAIRAEAATRDYFILSANHNFSPSLEAMAVRQFMQQDVEAVIVCNALDPDNFQPLKDSGIAIIQVERQRLQGTHQIDVELAKGFDVALETLRTLGHSRIAFLGWQAHRWKADAGIALTEHRRSEGFRQAADRYAFHAEDSPILLGKFDIGLDPTEVGRVLTRELLDRRERLPTAILTGSDVLAAGVLQELHAHGLSVPGDLSVIGYDDSIASYLSPPLTTISQPYASIASSAFSILDAFASDPHKRDPIRLVIENDLTPRASIGLTTVCRKR